MTRCECEECEYVRRSTTKVIRAGYMENMKTLEEVFVIFFEWQFPDMGMSLGVMVAREDE